MIEGHRQDLRRDAGTGRIPSSSSNTCAASSGHGQPGWTVYEASVERKKPDLEREAAYMDRTWDQTKERLLLAQKNFRRSLPTRPS